jgi:two-component system, NtrC family, response regulator HupR/HoxA
MDSPGTVLITSPVGVDWSPTSDILAEEYGYRVLVVRSAGEAAAALQDVHVDVVITEDSAGIGGSSFLGGLRASHPDIVRVLVLESECALSANAMAELAVYQFVRKPIDAQQICLVVKRGLETRELARRHRLLAREFKVSADSRLLDDRNVASLHPQSRRFEKLVFVSEKLSNLCDLARKAANTELPILIQGETGTGKELLARAIHYNSSRRNSPLMVQNCGGMPDDLLQSELFGHKRGAFTGAISDRLGLFRAADGGTVFLDEISDVSPSFQISLLRFLQNGEVKPFGSDKTLSSNVRVIAAANRSLKNLVAAGDYRQDLYFRLRGFELEVPPLRDRPEDIPVLAEFFAAEHSDAIGKKILGISAGAIEKLAAFDYPGNIRELENEIRRMVALAQDGEYLTTQNMSPAFLEAVARKARKGIGFVLRGTTLKDKVENVEKHVVADALIRHRWNQSQAAKELGLSRVGLANKIKRYDLDRGHEGATHG